MSSILKFLGLDRGGAKEAESSTGETETVRKIVQSLDRLEPARARYVAAFAYLLHRVASADMHIDEDETRVMERIIVEKAGLPEEQAILVIQMAKTQSALFGGTENFLVTQEFRNISTHEQRIGLLECLFLVSSADEEITTREDNEVRRIASELDLSHRDFIVARADFRQYLAVLKKTRRS